MALTRITKGVIKPNENYDTHNINSTGIVTAIGLDVNGNGDISGNLSVGGVLTYEDVTSIDSVGIITAQKGIHVGAGVSAVGVGTFGSLDISGDVDVDGHTNLDNINIVGVTTTTDNIHIGTRTHTANSSTALKNIHAGGEFWNGTEGDYRALKFIAYQNGTTNSYGLGVSNSTLELQSNNHISMFAGGVSGTTKTRRFHITSGGDYLFDSGTLYVQDKIGHYNDANTNIRFPAADTITAETAGSERLRIDAAGNMALGKGSASSTNYGTNFQIHSPDTSGAALHLTNSTSGSGNSDGFHLVQQSHIYYWLREDAHQIFATNGTERARILSGGNVLIGTTSDSTQKLTLYGTNAAVIYQGANTGTGAGQGFITGNNGNVNGFVWNYENGFIHFGTNGAERLRITSGGNIGIGTNNPATKTAIVGSDSGDVYLQIANSTTGSDANSGFLVGLKSDEGATLYQMENNYMRFGTNGAERLRITSDGKLLVGATAPTNGSIAEFSKSVAGGAAGCHITVENTSTNSVNNTAGIHLKTDQGIAKFFTYRAAQTYLQSRAGGASELLLQANGAHPMRLYTNSNERLRITSDGIVNIGGNFTQNSYKLSVYTASGASIIAKSASSTHPTANIWCHNDTANWLALGVWGSAATTSGLITANDALVGANNDLCLYSTNASGNVKFGAGSGYPELMRLTSSGNLNITGDLTQTSYVLSVTNSSNTNLLRLKTANEGDYDLRFNIQNNESHMWHYGTDDFVIGNRYDRKLHFITNGSKRLTIHGSYIGINQTAPQTGLHINQDWVNSYGSVSVEGSANALVGLGLRSNGNYRGSFIWRDGSSGNYMDISTYGNDAYDILFRQNGNERSRVTTHGLKITNAQSGNLGAALRINTDYTNYGTIIVRDKNETYTSCLQCENENGGASTENRVYRSVNRSSTDWAGANLEARFHNFRINGSSASNNKFYIDNNGVRSNGAVSGTVCNSYKANTSYNNYGVFTARDASSANEHNAAFQVENPSNGSDTTNQFMRSVDLSSNNWANAKYSAKSHQFLTSGSSSSNEIFRITDDGHAIHFGNQTSLTKYNDGVQGSSWYGDKNSWQQGQSGAIGWSMMYFNKIGHTNVDNRIMQFASSGSVIGYINRSGSNTQFATSSDYRLKKDVVALPNGIERVKQLRPVAFKWKSDNTDMEGFLAHEAQEICPYAVSGTKDEVATEDQGDRKKGDMIVQSVDYGEFTPLLTAAMKELIAKVETLEAEVAALKGS